MQACEKDPQSEMRERFGLRQKRWAGSVRRTLIGTYLQPRELVLVDRTHRLDKPFLFPTTLTYAPSTCLITCVQARRTDYVAIEYDVAIHPRKYRIVLTINNYPLMYRKYGRHTSICI